MIGPEVVRKGSVAVQTSINNGEIITGSYEVIDTPAREEKSGNVTIKGTPSNNSVFYKPKLD